ncbi:hypothetical protein EVAR_33259_1 [Eumeta japonica]|uniref:Uncharacterized protein n=1 Tax=Eumeta variegata TaxID=151549 RepID=A0A4C1WYT2_EUMVA|nr:hypothetical protein EVAR_33259_1 [Eumeta japonica]
MHKSICIISPKANRREVLREAIRAGLYQTPSLHLNYKSLPPTVLAQGRSTKWVDHHLSVDSENRPNNNQASVAVFLRAAFPSVGLRMCMSVWGTAQCTSCDGSHATCVRPADMLRFIAPSACRARSRFLRLGSAPIRSHSRYRSLF